jgi:hypothetical protein
MIRAVVLAVVGSFLVVPFTVRASSVGEARPAVHEQLGRAWDEVGRELRDLVDQWRKRLGGGAPSSEERPMISIMLRNRDRLGLSADQVSKLEQLRTDFEKASIRHEADLRIAEMDLRTLLEAPSVDMKKVEAKVREIERSRADLRLARIRTIEKGKEELSAEQRNKFQELMSDSRLTRLQSALEP